MFPKTKSSMLSDRKTSRPDAVGPLSLPRETMFPPKETSKPDAVGLLTLPQEIRDQILFEACSDRVLKITAHDAYEANRSFDIPIIYDPRSVTTPYILPSMLYDLRLLLVCHQLYNETVSAARRAYFNNKFHFTSDCAFLYFAEYAPITNFAAIEKIHIDTVWWGDICFRYDLDAIRYRICVQFTGVKEMDLWCSDQPEGIRDQKGRVERIAITECHTGWFVASLAERVRTDGCVGYGPLDVFPEEMAMYNGALHRLPCMQSYQDESKVVRTEGDILLRCKGIEYAHFRMFTAGSGFFGSMFSTYD